MALITKKSRRWVFAFSCALVLMMLTGCAPQVVRDEPELVVEEATVQATIPDPLEIYRSNLIENFKSDLDQMKDAAQYRIEIDIGDDINVINGYQEVIFTNPLDEALDEIYFRLFPNFGGDYLRVQDVRIDGEVAQSSLSYQNTALRVLLRMPLQPGEKTHITMSFFQQVPTEMGGNYGLYIYQEDILALDAFFPIIPVVTEGGWLVDNLPHNADMIFTEAALFRVKVSAPGDLVLVASGVEIERLNEDGRQIITFVGGPQRDFYIAASRRFASSNIQIGGTILSSYYPEEYQEIGETILKNASRAFISFSERYGYYPYTELDLVSTPMQAGGMEYSGAAALALHLYGSEMLGTDEPGTIFLESATAHELAHQWFFNQVMNDPQNEPWLDEGLAQYLTYIYYLDAYDQSAANRYIDTWYARWKRVDEMPIPIGRPAGAYSGVEYSAIIYGRAPLFMLELERKLGAVTFDEFLRDYAATYRWQTVNSDQFKSLAEKNCNCDLTPLFEEWVWEMD